MRIIIEGTRYDKKASKIISDSGLFDEETSTNIIQALFKEDIHAFNHAPAWLEKYLVGIARMLVEYCNGDSSKAQEFLTDSIPTFEYYLTWVKENREKFGNSLDTEFNQRMSYQDLQDKVQKIQDELDQKSKDELSTMKFSKSNYELVPINSFDEFNSKFGGRLTGNGSSDKYAGGGGTAWCHANSENTYNSWTRRGMFFVLANKDFKNIPFNKESNKNNPKDDYGNSLIALLVNKRSGSLLNATLRCNHVGINSNADNQYKTYAELSKIAGFNVENKVNEYLDKHGYLLKNKENLWNTFDGSRTSLVDITDALGITYDELTSVTIPNGVTRIDNYAFENCTSLTSVEIPNSVTSIGNYAFYDCINLLSVEIPDSVKSIGNFSFVYCTSLTSIEIPNSVTSIGDGVFEYCKSLTSIEIPDDVTSIGGSEFYGCDSLTSITIPNSVTSIEMSAFANCSSLTSITIPDSVTSIGDYVFSSCTSLTSVTIPDSVESIGEEAFSRCKSLTSIEIPNSVTSIGGSAFSDCKSLTSITIPNSVTSIGDWVFSNCSSLTSITIPNSVTSIGDDAFLKCLSLTSITIPNSVTSIGSNAFYNCPNLVVHTSNPYVIEYCIENDIKYK